MVDQSGGGGGGGSGELAHEDDDDQASEADLLQQEMKANIGTRTAISREICYARQRMRQKD